MAKVAAGDHFGQKLEKTSTMNKKSFLRNDLNYSFFIQWWENDCFDHYRNYRLHLRRSRHEIISEKNAINVTKVETIFFLTNHVEIKAYDTNN